MSWKDNPFAIAVATSAATIALGATVVFTAVIPTWLRLQDNEIAAQHNEIAAQQAQIRDLETEVAGLEAVLEENVKLRRDLDRLSPLVTS